MTIYYPCPILKFRQPMNYLLQLKLQLHVNTKLWQNYDKKKLLNYTRIMKFYNKLGCFIRLSIINNMMDWRAFPN